MHIAQSRHLLRYNIISQKNQLVLIFLSLMLFIQRFIIDFEFGVTDKSKKFLEKFPFGKVPAVELR